MCLYDKLPQEDINQLNHYLNSYSDGGNIKPEDMKYFLRYWSKSRQHFFKMFGEKFILKKEVYFEKRVKELEKEMRKALRSSIVYHFRQAFKSRVNELYDSDSIEYYDLMAFVDSWPMLVRNEYLGNSFLIPGKYTQNGHSLRVNTGCKAVKMLGKIASALGVEVKSGVCQECGDIGIIEDKCPVCGGEVKEIDGYEAFRQAHSQVLNQKKVKGSLCLSIHPLDFLTMSDNNCGWTSCMSWIEDYGDYRMGTVEMMNSSCVVIAYIEAKDPMWVCGREWNNKKWRQLYIVTPELILGNKQYPYQNDELQGTAIKWLRELATATVGYGPYTEETHNIYNDEWNTINGDKRIHFELYADYMYNDVYDSRLAYVAPTQLGDSDIYSLNFSGPAICCGCGDDIAYNTIEPHRVLCRACDGHWRCDYCGDWHSEYDACYDVGDSVYCDWCYHNELESCECCGNKTDYHLNHIYIQALDTENDEIIQSFNYNYYVSMCDDCLESPESYIADFGPVFTVMDMWGMPRKVFDIKNITDEGLNRGDLSGSAIEFLKSMRAANDDESRLALIREISY